jgi:hypothetical protein
MEKKSSQNTYNSSLTSKGSLIEETLNVFRLVVDSYTKNEIKHKIIHEGFAGGDTYGTRESIWSDIHARFLSNNPRLPLVAQYILTLYDKNAQKFILFYELCQSSPVLNDVTLYCVYPRYMAGFSKIDSEIILQYFAEISEGHPEIEAWSDSTRKKLARNLLTILRDFGLLRGKNQKEFHRLYIPMSVFSYILYRCVDQNITSPQEIINAEEWKLFFLDEDLVLQLLDEASKNGVCNFKRQGDLLTIDFMYASWEEFVEEYITKI